MESGLQNQEQLPQNLRKQLAIAVRSIQWSYSIFWSISPSDSSLLEWSEGFYNGDIKTRKTVQEVEFNADELGLQRSKQLRQLYESLLASGETNPQTKRLSASLSPEDLSNTEWYYLVCMSFVFDLGQGLPGRALESGQPIWLCNAHQADSRVFSRSLLAKTVVCFPFLGGVIELGITDMVLEDHSVIQNAQASLLGIDSSMLVPFEEDESSSGFGLVQPLHKTRSMVEGVNEDLIDDELSNSLYTSMTSSDCCISQNLVNNENYPMSLSNTEVVDEISPQEHYIQDQFRDDLHYKNVVMSLFKGTHELISEPCTRNRDKESSFVRWRKEGIGSYLKHTNGISSQRVLKKILIEVPRLYRGSSDELASNHVIAERRRRERVNDKFSTLKLLIPSIDKVDKVSILDDTINHLKELKRRIHELESSQDLDECRTLTKPQDMSERTSDNYGNNKPRAKRKADESDEVMIKHNSMNTNISISLIEKDVLIKLICPWKECLLLEIMDALSNLKLDTHSIQSSTSESILSVTIKAKIRGLQGSSAGKIRQVLQRVVMKVG
ncbi:hypothetical protein V2J09_020241 [Rumex salicifolius]